MRARDFIAESLDVSFPYTWQEKSSDSWYAVVDSNEIKMDLHAYVINDRGWEISWERDGAVGRIKTDPTLARKIIATVNDMVSEFVNTVKPEYVFLSTTTQDSGKASLFFRILEKLGYHGHHVSDPAELEDYNLYDEYTWYIFEKNS